jgi:L-histidine N-alpha-methyltransferase
MSLSPTSAVDQYDMLTTVSDFKADLVKGLGSDPKSIPSKYLFDKKGSELFDLETRQPEYYLAESEHEIYSYFGPEVARALGENVLIIEPGSGACIKVGLLMESFEKPAGYVAIDLSKEFMVKSVEKFAEKHPSLPLSCIAADYFHLDPMPATVAALGEKRLVFFPGSTIGFYDREEAIRLLASLRDLAGPGGKILVGADLQKSPDLIKKAYGDQAQVADRFHLNLLQRANREAGANFDLLKFRYDAVYNEDVHRVETYVVSMASQSVTVDDQKFEIANGERIRTGYAYKYTAEQFQELAEDAGCRPVGLWLDSRQYFSVHLLEGSLGVTDVSPEVPDVSEVTDVPSEVPDVSPEVPDV